MRGIGQKVSMDTVQSFPRMVLASQRSSLTKRRTQYFGAAFNCQTHKLFLVSLQLLIHTTPPTFTLTKLVHPIHRVNQGSCVKNQQVIQLDIT